MCGVRQVAYKMPSIQQIGKCKRRFFCWECAAKVLARFQLLEVDKPFNKAKSMAHRFVIKPKPVHEVFELPSNVENSSHGIQIDLFHPYPGNAPLEINPLPILNNQ